MSFFAELQRRQVYRVAILYAVVGFAAIEGADIIGGQLDLPAAFARFVRIATLAGFPIALLLAWVYDLTSKGVVRTDESVSEISTPMVVAILAGAALVLGGTSWWVTLTPGPIAESQSIAVAPLPASQDDDLPQTLVILPFDDLSPNGDQSHFSQGMSDELIFALGARARAESEGPHNGCAGEGDGDVVETIGEKTGAVGLIDGSVRLAGDRLHIQISFLGTSPLWDPIHDDPRFQALLVEMNLTDVQRR